AAGHWTAVRSALSLPRIIEGLGTPHPVSSYMENSDGSTHVAAIDFDREDGWEVGLAVARKIAAAGGWPMLEQSRRGCHLWLVLDAVVPGWAARAALRDWVGQTGPYLARDPKIELLPKKLEQRGPGSVGSPVRVPMMSHPGTGRRYPLCDAAGTALGKSISSILLGVETTPARLVQEVAAASQVP